MSPQYSIRALRHDLTRGGWHYAEVAVVSGTLKQAEAEAVRRCKNTAHYVCLLTEKSVAWAGATEAERT